MVNGLMSELEERGLDLSTPRLYILEGGKTRPDTTTSAVRAFSVKLTGWCASGRATLNRRRTRR